MKPTFLSKVYQTALMCCLAVILTGCDELLSALDNPIQTTLVMTTTDVKLTVGDTYQRQATTVSPATIVYASSDATVATVDANGVVEAIAEGEAIITASVAEVDYWTAASTSYKVIVSAKTPATITTPPTATASIEPNSETALVTAGVADGGELMYAVTTTNTRPTTTEGFIATIPTAATLAAGTYYVWYYAKGDATHSDSEIAATAIEVKVGNFGLLAGKFSVSSTQQVQFSQGNLQATYDGTKWTWAFAANQWDFIGDNTTTATGNGNTSINGDGTVSAANVTVDLFGWVGASNTTWGTGAAKYGISNNNNNPSTNGDYGTGTSDALKSDWGNTMDADWSNKTGESTTGWRTLTKDEWAYLFNTRTTTSGIRYAKATVNGKAGVILLPDDWSTSYYGLSTTADYTANDITLADWTDKLEAHGAVFLPAAGYRDVTTVNNVGTLGLYWSSSPHTNASKAYCAYFSSSSLMPTYSFIRYYGFSVRLVRDAE